MNYSNNTFIVKTLLLTQILSFTFCHFVIANPAAPPKPKQNWALEFNPSEGSVEFIAVGKPKAIKIHGKGEGPKGKLQLAPRGKPGGELFFALGTIDTGINLRNEHMKKKYLDTAAFPLAKLDNLTVALPPARKGEAFEFEKIPFQGRLSLHGVTQPIKGFVDLKRNGLQLKINARFDIKISDFKIDIPTFAGITVTDEVQVHIQADAPMVIQK